MASVLLSNRSLKKEAIQGVHGNFAQVGAIFCAIHIPSTQAETQ